jgi:hypothetical protein
VLQAPVISALPSTTHPHLIKPTTVPSTSSPLPPSPPPSLHCTINLPKNLRHKPNRPHLPRGRLSGATRRIRHRAIKAQLRIPSIRSALIARTQALNERLSIQTSLDGSSIGLADVAELVAEAVGDDVGVESFLLALGGERVDHLERELVCRTPAETTLEFDRGHAEAEVQTCDGGLLACACVVAVAGRGVVLVVGSVVGVVICSIVGVVIRSIVGVVIRSIVGIVVDDYIFAVN